MLAAVFVQLRFDVGAKPLGEEVQRLLIHRAPMDRLGVFGIFVVDPAERVEGPVVGGRIALQALFHQPGDRALAAAHRTVQQQHAALDAIAGRSAFERVDQVMQGPVQPEYGIFAVVVGIVEEAVVEVLLATFLAHVHSVRENHVVEPLIRGPRHFGLLANDVQVLGERADPILAAELFAILTLGY